MYLPHESAYITETPDMQDKSLGEDKRVLSVDLLKGTFSEIFFQRD